MEDLPLSGRTALVTGAGRGIGLAIANALADAGAEVALVARTTSDVRDAAREIERRGGTAIGLGCDVTDRAAVDALLAALGDRFDGLDVLVNNAGGAHWIRELQDIDEDMFHAGLTLNLTSVQNVLRAAGSLLFARSGTASVVNVASIAAVRGLEGMSYYSAAKSAVVGLTRAVSREWGPRGVRVNCVLPGWVETDLSKPLRENEDFYGKTVAEIPLGRWATPADIAPAAVFLAGNGARYITGSTLYVDGGLLA